MNLSQRQNLLNLIQNFENKNFASILAQKYKNSGPLEGIIIEDYSISDILSLAKRAVSQLKYRLEADDWQVLPVVQNLSEYGQINIEGKLLSISQSLERADCHAAIRDIKALVFYQMSFGFWTISKKTEIAIKEKALDRIEERLNVLSEITKEKNEDAQKLLEELENKKNVIDGWIKEKREEYQILRNNQNESNSLIANIRNTEKNTQQLISSISKARDAAEKIIEQVSANSEISSEQIATSRNLIDKSNQELENITKISEECLKGVKENFDQTTESAKEIKRMMGYIADGTLSHSFNQRKQAINTKAKKWLLISILTFLFAIAWIVIVFTCLMSTTESVWANILIGAIKSSIAVFAFGYSLNEYGKERNLQEEYAFRESVAITLTAYLQQLETCDKEEMKKLMVNTVEKLYTKPVISAKEYKLMKMDSNEIADLLKSILNSVKK